MRPLARGLLGAAAGIALVTVAARVVGFGRTAVLSRTLGTSCVGDVYSAVNAVPNVVFEVVAGGALASVVVPVLAGAVASGDHAAASRTASALLSWTVALLVPVALLGALAAPQIVRALLGPDPACAAAVGSGSRMLVVFMPQVVLYGIGVVLTGVLQAHRRFLGPALAPLLSSLVVVMAYLAYAARGPVEDVAALPRGQELVLSVGTTLGVAVLALSLLVPLRRCDLRLRPTFAFPPGVAARVRRLAGAGVAGLAAQQLALVVALRLALGGSPGSVVVFAVATALFLLPWAVLAVPVATSAFPALSASASAGQEQEYAAVARRSLRVVLLAMTLSAAVLAAVARPVARLLVQGAPGVESSEVLARATLAFAPGLVGYGLLALLGRALYARGDARTSGAATVSGWLAVAAADVLLVRALPEVDRVVLLGVGNTIGVSVAGVLLLVGLQRAAGPTALAGAGRSALVGIVAGAVALGGTGLLDLPAGGVLRDLLGALLAAGVVAGVFLAVVRLLDAPGLRAVRGG
ncbi:MAG: lipid II flippase MurJ [Mycobacteriales bacterium]